VNPKKMKVGALAGVLVLSMALAGCGRDDKGSGGVTTKEGGEGGTIYLGTITDLTGPFAGVGEPFTAGQAAFLRNWSYVYSIAQDPKASQVVNKVGVVPLPHFAGGESAACLGGYQYGINAATQNREAAVDFLTWMSSPATQLHFALQLGIAPTRPAVFDDQKLGAEQPFMQQLKSVFTGATPRPVTPKYAQVTLAIQSGVSRALATGNVKAELDAANEKITSVVAS